MPSLARFAVVSQNTRLARGYAGALNIPPLPSLPISLHQRYPFVSDHPTDRAIDETRHFPNSAPNEPAKTNSHKAQNASRGSNTRRTVDCDYSQFLHLMICVLYPSSYVGGSLAFVYIARRTQDGINCSRLFSSHLSISTSRVLCKVAFTQISLHGGVVAGHADATRPKKRMDDTTVR